MKMFEDSVNELVWYTAQYIDTINGEKVFASEDIKQLNELRLELNSWQSEDIERYITRRALLGDFLSFCYTSCSYFAYDSGDLAAVVMLENGSVIEMMDLQRYIEYCEKYGINGVERCLSLNDAIDVLDNSTVHNSAYLDYIVAAPHMLGKGKRIGTRAISSINTNPEFFTGSPDIRYMSAGIHNCNTASKVAFQRSGWLPIYKDPDFDEFNIPDGFDMYYHVIEDKEL